MSIFVIFFVILKSIFVIIFVIVVNIFVILVSIFVIISVIITVNVTVAALTYLYCLPSLLPLCSS